MGITFRHDAAAVVPPSNNATRKYGQSLVLQQQQQKYATQQAQQDRMFDAQKQLGQMQFQQNRAVWENEMAFRKEGRQNELMQQQQRAADFAAARSRMDAYAKDSLNNPNIPPELRAKIQNLVSSKMVAMGSGLNEAQQKEFLDQYNAQLSGLLAEVPPPKPQPTEQEMIDSMPVMDGVRYGKDKDGNPVPVMVQDEETGRWKPYEKPSSSRSSGQKGSAKGDSSNPGALQRPVTFEEYYGADEDKFQEALNAELQTMQDNFVPDPEGKKKMPTREDALNKMRDDYDFRQKALGKAQYGEPTLAPEDPKPFGQRLEELRSQSRSSGTREDYKAFEGFANTSKSLQALQDKIDALPSGSKEREAANLEWRKERDRLIKLDQQASQAAPPEMKSILEQPGQQKIPATPMPGQPVPTAPSAPSPAQPAPSPPVAVTPPSPAQNAWEQVATPPATPTPQATPQSPAPNDVDMGAVDSNGRIIPNNKTTTTKQKPPQSAKQPAAPDFGALASRSNGANKQAILAIQNIYQSQTPDVQAAISVLLDDNSQHTDAAKALAYLQSKGIDIRSLTAKSKPDTQYRALGAGGR